jgi:hypothetical protein
MIYRAIAPRIKHPTLSEKNKCQVVFQKWYGIYDVIVRVCFAIITKPKNILPTASFQIYLKVGVALPILMGHITEKQFLAMWLVKDLKWKKS